MKMIHKRLLVHARRVAAVLSFLAVLFAPAITNGRDQSDVHSLTGGGLAVPKHAKWQEVAP